MSNNASKIPAVMSQATIQLTDNTTIDTEQLQASIDTLNGNISDLNQNIQSLNAALSGIAVVTGISAGDPVDEDEAATDVTATDSTDTAAA